MYIIRTCEGSRLASVRPQKVPQMTLMWARQGKTIYYYACYLIRVPPLLPGEIQHIAAPSKQIKY